MVRTLDGFVGVSAVTVYRGLSHWMCMISSDRVDAERLDVVELGDESRQVADAVIVAVCERLGPDL